MLLFLALGLLIVSQCLVIAFNGEKLPRPDIPREVTLGKGSQLSYVVIGDSTAIGLGADYKQGIAYKSAEFLAKKHKVKLTNLGLSGATTAKVLHNQVEAAAKLKPEIVLIAVGANDVTHLSALGSVEENMTAIIKVLQRANPKTKILLTGSPAMGSIPRFPQPTKFLAGVRTQQINKVIQELVDKKGVTRLKIAEETGPAFLKNPRFFANDKFHPNKNGYAVWLPIIYKELNLYTSDLAH